MTRITRSIVACVFALSPAAAAVADTITLKSAARHQGDTNIVALGDIATLEGDEAQRLAGVQVGAMKSSGKPLEIAVADVRTALDAAGVNWAKVNLCGRSVIVRPIRDAATPPPQAMTASVIDGLADIRDVAAPGAADESVIALDELITLQTVSGSIANLIAANLRIDARSMRVSLASRDADLLNTPLANARFEVQPLGSLAGDRMVFEVRTWNGAEAVTCGQITLKAQRLAQVSKAARDLSRGDAIDESCVHTSSVWLTPSEAMQAAPLASIVGRSATRSLNAGETIRVRDLEREALIKRGQLITVRCLVGGVAISMQAEARAEGSLGDAIEFRKAGEREAFIATVTGANEAIVDLSRK